jgi:biotin synthase-related radical SAM superfamily protein
LKEILSSGAAFQTSGCKDCNRPYYNERPSGPLYNYPRPLSQEEIAEAIAATGLVD